MTDSPSGPGGLISWLTKSAANKILTALLVVGVVGGLIWWYQLPEDSRAAAVDTVKSVLLWLLIAAALPWGLFFIPQLVLRAESNAVSALMLVGYAAIDLIVAASLMDWSIGGSLQWGALLFGLLAASAYNFLVCEFLALRAEE